jgi:hypothetical protein
VTVRRVGSPDQLELLVFQALKEPRQQTEQRIETGLQLQRRPERKRLFARPGLSIRRR